MRKFGTLSKKIENDKNTNFMVKSNKKVLKRYMKTIDSILYFEFAPLTRDVTCYKL